MKDSKFYFEGIQTGQVFGIEEQFIKILPNFDRIIEIGTYSGGFTLFLYKNMRTGCELVSYDINSSFNRVSEKYKIDFRIGDCFNENVFNEIKELMLDSSKRILLLCDGGDKNREFIQYSQFLKEGDVIMCHDFSESLDDFNKYAIQREWIFSSESNLDSIIESINVNKLDKYYYSEFKSIFWGSFIKK